MHVSAYLRDEHLSLEDLHCGLYLLEQIFLGNHGPSFNRETTIRSKSGCLANLHESGQFIPGLDLSAPTTSFRCVCENQRRVELGEGSMYRR